MIRRTLGLGVLMLGLAACSQDKGANPAPASSDAKDSTHLSIDTDNGSMSFESSEGGDSTSISIGDSAGKDNQDDAK